MWSMRTFHKGGEAGKMWRTRASQKVKYFAKGKSRRDQWGLCEMDAVV